MAIVVAESINILYFNYNHPLFSVIMVLYVLLLVNIGKKFALGILYHFDKGVTKKRCQNARRGGNYPGTIYYSVRRTKVACSINGARGPCPGRY